MTDAIIIWKLWGGFAQRWLSELRKGACDEIQKLMILVCSKYVTSQWSLVALRGKSKESNGVAAPSRLGKNKGWVNLSTVLHCNLIEYGAWWYTRSVLDFT